MRKNLFKIYLILLIIFLIYNLTLPYIPLFRKDGLFFISRYVIGGIIFLIFEVFFVASFFVRELDSKRLAIIIAFILFCSCHFIQMFYLYW